MKENLQTASRKVVINKSVDLLPKNMLIDIKKFRKQVKIVEEIRVNWNEKMKELQTKVFEEKDLVNVKKDVLNSKTWNS